MYLLIIADFPTPILGMKMHDFITLFANNYEFKEGDLLLHKLIIYIIKKKVKLKKKMAFMVSK